MAGEKREGDAVEGTRPAKVFGASASFTSMTPSGSSPFGQVGKCATTSESPFGQLGSADTVSFGAAGSDFSAESETATSLVLTERTVESGEEDETILLTERAKLFLLDAGDWRERGVGTLHLNVSKADTSRYRIVMRTDVVLRVILNVALDAGLVATISVVQGKNLRFVSSDGEGVLRTFLLRFKGPQNADRVCQEILRLVPDDLSKVSSSEKEVKSVVEKNYVNADENADNVAVNDKKDDHVDDKEDQNTDDQNDDEYVDGKKDQITEKNEDEKDNEKDVACTGENDDAIPKENPIEKDDDSKEQSE